MKMTYVFSFCLLTFFQELSTKSFIEHPVLISYKYEDSCPSGYSAFYAFDKVINSDAYKCYGKPSNHYKEYSCPNRKKGTCLGTYVKQEFCNNGKRVFLYHTETKCTCGCVDKNFHGRKLNILDLSPCGCDDNLEEIIGVEY